MQRAKGPGLLLCSGPGVPSALVRLQGWGGPSSTCPTDIHRVWQALSQAVYQEEFVVLWGDVAVAQGFTSGGWWADSERGPVPSWNRPYPSLSLDAHSSLSVLLPVAVLAGAYPFRTQQPQETFSGFLLN